MAVKLVRPWHFSCRHAAMDVRASCVCIRSFVKCGESIIETRRLFRCRFNIGCHGNIHEVGHIFSNKRNDNEEETFWSCRNCTKPGERGKSERGHREESNPFCSATCCRIRNFSYTNSLKWHLITYHFVIINKFYTKN